MVREWHNNRTEEKLNHVTIETEMKTIENKISKYNVEKLGDIPLERDDGTMRVLISQMGGCASLEM